jgi:putative FmdB family regulatory protein
MVGPRLSPCRNRGDCLCRSSGLESKTEEFGTFREVAIPQYEYLCLACNKKFSLHLTVTEHDKGPVNCSKCKSPNVEQQWAAFFATTSKKS